MNTAEDITGKGTFYLPLSGGSAVVKAAVFFSQKSGRYLAFIEPPAVIPDSLSPALRQTLAAIEKQIAWLNERGNGQFLEAVDVAAV